MSSDLAKVVWNAMEGRMNIYSVARTLNLKLNDWYLSLSRSPCHKMLLSLITNCVCWELWKRQI